MNKQTINAIVIAAIAALVLFILIGIKNKRDKKKLLNSASSDPVEETQEDGDRRKDQL